MIKITEVNNLIGLIMLSHGPLAIGLYESSRFFINDLQHIECLALNSEDNPLDFQSKIEVLYNKVNDNDGVIIFTDIPGGSPANQAQLIANMHPDIRIICGMNLIMVIEALIHRETMDLKSICELIIQSGKESIFLINSVLVNDENDMDSSF